MFVFVYFLLYEFFLGYVIKNKVFDSVELSNINIRALMKKWTAFIII